MKKKKLQIIDLTNRLPGPLSCKFLQDNGVFVTKIENENYSDPFNTDFYKTLDPIFPSWYEDLNKAKKIIKLNLKNQNDIKTFNKILDKSHLVITNFPEKILNEIIQSKNIPILKILASKSNKNLHDLNLQAQSGLLKKTKEFYNLNENQLCSLPFPLMGISFSKSIANRALIMCINIHLLKNSDKLIEEIYFDEEIDKTFNIFSKHTPKKLFTGEYPCYSIYKLKENNNYLVVATIEEHFWVEFCHDFNLKLNVLDRFDKDKKNYISERINQLTYNQAANIINSKNYCVSII
jgi:alpha-methylacyl-CoA racemase